jgi:hypothetical protein
VSLKTYSSTRNETFKSTLLRWGFNLFPAYFSTAAKITFLSGDFQEVHVKIPLNWRTRDQSGELFKGIQYAAVDPIYPKMLRNNLDDTFSIRDDQSSIQFLQPCDRSVTAELEINDEEIQRIKNELEHHDSVIRVYKIELKGEDGTVFTEVEKTLTVSRKETPKNDG